MSLFELCEDGDREVSGHCEQVEDRRRWLWVCGVCGRQNGVGGGYLRDVDEEGKRELVRKWSEGRMEKMGGKRVWAGDGRAGGVRDERRSSLESSSAWRRQPNSRLPQSEFPFNGN